MTKPAILSTLTGDSARARRSDPETSHAAADSISAEALEDREREVIRIVRAAPRPLCAEEIEEIHLRRSWNGAAEIHYGTSSIRTAKRQLVDAGVLVRDGSTKTSAGREAEAWRLATDDDEVIALRAGAERDRRLAAKRESRRTHAPTRGTSAA